MRFVHFFFKHHFPNITRIKYLSQKCFPYVHNIILNAWKTKWSSYTWPSRNGINQLFLKSLLSNLFRSHIISITRSRSGNNCLCAHSFYLGLNLSPPCPHHLSPDISDFSHLVFHCPCLSFVRINLFHFL